MKPRMVSLLICSMLIINAFGVFPQNVGYLGSGSGGTGGPADSLWPMSGYDIRRSGLSPYDTSANPGQLKWSFTTGDYTRSSPAIGPNGTIYVGSRDNMFYAIYPNGTEKWKFPTGDNVDSSPTIGPDGTIFVGSNDNRLYAINPDGSLKWNFLTGHEVHSSPAIDPNGTIYVGSFDSKLYAINPDGTEKWSYLTGGLIFDDPAIGTDGTIYIGSYDFKLYAINPDGTEKWNFTTGDKIADSDPAIGSDGTIYIGSDDEKLYAINPNGTEKWNYPAGERVASCPSFGPDGTIYFGNDINKFNAVNPDGSLKWCYWTSKTGIWYSSAAIGSDGTIYVGLDKIYAFNPDGTVKWNYTTGGHVRSSPAIDADGTIYVGSADHKLYAIGTPTQNQPPVADAGPDLSVDEGEAVELDGSASYDPDGTIESYEWDFENDGIYDYQETPTNAPDGAFDGKAMHIYGDNGIYTVMLRVADDTGAIDIDTCIVTDYNIGPWVEPIIAQGATRVTEGVTEEWVARYNGPGNGLDSAYAIDIDNLGNIYVTGKDYGGSGTYNDYATVAYDSSGNERWVARYDGPGNDADVAWDIGTDSLGNVYVTGSSYGDSRTRTDYATIAYDALGNELWVARYNGLGSGGDASYAIAVDSLGNVYVTGQSDGGSGAGDDYATVAYDSSGNELWVARYDGPGNDDQANNIAIDESSGDVYVTGYSESSTDWDYATIKYDSSGKEQWVRRYNGPSNERDAAYGMAVDSFGNVYVTGWSEGIGTGRDIATVAYDSLGNELWVVRYNGPGNGYDDAFKIAFDESSGNLYVIGVTEYFTTGEDYVTIAYDPMGNELWVKRYNGPGNGYDEARSIALDEWGNVYVTGFSYSGIGTNDDYATVAYDSSGNELWVARYNGSGNNDDIAWDIATDPLGNVYVTGRSIGVGTDYDYTTIKYSFSTYYECNEGSLVKFTANASDPGSDDLTFTWDWGDGTPDTVTTHYNNGIGPEPVYDPATNEIKSPWGTYPFTTTDTVSHTYGDNGVYKNTLTVEDDDGGTTIITINVTVLNVAPALDPNDPYSGNEGSPITFIATGTDPGSDDLTFTWNWDDGTSPTTTTFFNDGIGPDPYPSPLGTYPFTAIDTVQHTYGDNGVYNVTVTVEDDDGGTAVVTTTVTVYNIAPTITMVIAPSGDEGSLLIFEAEATDPGSDDLTFSWEFEYGPTINHTFYNNGLGPDTSQSPLGTYPFSASDTVTHTYGDNYNYTLNLRVEDDDGSIALYSTIISVDNIAPSITEIIIPYPAEEGIESAFRATAKDEGSDDLTFEWDFGDLTSMITNSYYNDGINPDLYPSPDGSYPFSAQDTVNHTYGDNYNYTLILKVTDDDGGITTLSTVVIVYNIDPIIEPFGPCSIDEGSPLDITATCTDPGSDDLTFIWEFEFGPTVTNVHYNDGADPDPYPSPWGTYPFSVADSAEHTYGDNGVYTLTLIVEDDDGGSTVYITNITVNNVAPKVDALQNATIDEGGTVTFSGHATDPGSDDLTFTWNWGYVGFGNMINAYLNNPPSPDPYPSPEVNPRDVIDTVSQAYGDNGVFIVTLTVTDDDGGSTTVTTTITVNNVAPTADADGPYTGDENETIIFTGHSTDPGSDDLTFTWNWSDGSSDTVTIYYNDPPIGPDPFPSPEINPRDITEMVIHTYGDNGVYTITLTVEDDDGGITTVTTIITVYNLAPTIDPFGPFTIDEGSPIAVTATANDPGSDDLQFEWEFELGPTISNSYYNDGIGPDPYPSPWGIFPFSATDTVTHTYGDNYVYAVTLTVTDDDGGVATYATTVTVDNVAPQIDSLPALTIYEGEMVTFSGHATDPGSDDLTFTWNWAYVGFGNTINTYLNNPPGSDPYPSPEVNPRDVIDTVSQTYGDNGDFTITLTVADDDGGATTVNTTVTVDNVSPTIINVEAFMYVNITLRVAGSKWSNVGLTLFEDGNAVGYLEVERWPGSPDDNPSYVDPALPFVLDMTKSYNAVVTYDPYPDNGDEIEGDQPNNGKDKKNNAGNPVWIIIRFEDGNETNIHHTFNTEQSMIGNSSHQNHVEPWEVELAPYFRGHNITFEATAMDPGSDDLIFSWDFDDGGIAGPNLYYNNGMSPDLFPSPEVNPMNVTDTVTHAYSASGIYTVTLTVMDDDGSISTTLLIIVLLG